MLSVLSNLSNSQIRHAVSTRDYIEQMKAASAIIQENSRPAAKLVGHSVRTHQKHYVDLP